MGGDNQDILSNISDISDLNAEDSSIPLLSEEFEQLSSSTNDEDFKSKNGDGSVPVTTNSELSEILRLSWPVALATLCRLAIYSTDSAFVGHISTSALSGVTLAGAWIQFVGTPVSFFENRCLN